MGRIRSRIGDGMKTAVKLRMAASGQATAPPHVAWLESWWANDLAIADSDIVSTWPGRSGAFALDQPSPAKRPVYDASELSLAGRPVVVFDGVNDFMRLASWGGTITQPYSYVVIGVMRSVSASYICFVDRAHNLTPGTGSFFGVEMGQWRLWAGTLGFLAGAPTTGPAALRALVNDSSSRVVHNGAHVTSGAVGSGELIGLTVGANRGDNDASALSVAFVGAYDGDVSTDSGWPAFVAWAAATYGVVLS